MSKIFCVGLQRTGTTSLNKALNILGYNSIHGPYQLFNSVDDPLISRFDAFTDNPIPLLYKKLDSKFPNSKFILTTRDIDTWLESVEWLFERGYSAYKRNKYPEINRIHKSLYGRETFDRIAFKDKWLEHKEDVLNYFKERKSDLLILDQSQNFNWNELCNFLNQPVPDTPFPYKHKSTLPLTISTQLKNKLYRIFSN